MTAMRFLLLIVGALWLAGCASTPTGDGTPDSVSGEAPITTDGPPVKEPPVDVTKVPQPEPRGEPLSRLGNPDSYDVMGQRYQVLTSARGYRETGTASWYGRKFHGRSTSSGEPYDMYELTAAHKELPLPSYARVKNLENGREIIVRINDRGPFHGDRIIDLSYAAAAQLGFLDNGTAKVRVETIATGTARSDNPANPALYLQTGAFSNARNARGLAKRLEEMGLDRVFVSPTASDPPLYRVRIGPYPDAEGLADARQRLAEQGIQSNTLRD